MITTAHVAVSPLTGERHTLIKDTHGWEQACNTDHWFLTCACMDDEGCSAR